MQAMDPAAAEFYEGDGEDLDPYDFQPLPTLPEDEENVSLADILSLRDRGLGEREAWAVCLECCLAMRSVAHAGLFHTLCITPDTLAFNTSGNVCFMEQLSDDPEGAFVPPEFDVTGNTFEAHIYSLGATLKAALEYVAEPEPRLSHDLELLLSQMQAEDPGDRPGLESIIALCEEKVPATSSCRLCCSLSAVGRRVLSIESFGACPDVSDSSWRGRPAPRSLGPKRPPGDLDADAEAPPAPEAPGKTGDAPEGRGPRETRPAEGPQAGAPCLSPAAPRLLPPDPGKALPEGTRGPSSLEAQPRSPPRPLPELQQKGARSAGRGGDAAAGTPCPGPVGRSPPPRSEDPRDAGQDPASFGPEEWLPEGAGEPGSAAAEQGVSLQDLLSKLGRPFREYELWALSHACLHTLRSHRQHPAYLCPDSVLVAEDGAVLFGLPPANGAYDAFFLAPEVAEQTLVTEKASVYCVAAVLWAAAKFGIPRECKLPLPRRLKTLLLHMARRSAQERPSAAEAIKVCGTYLLQRGMDSRKILAHLRASTCRVRPQEETIGLQNAYSAPAAGSGFVHVSGDARLVAVQGPVPGPPSGCEGPRGLPAAFPPAATRFKPIVLAPPAGAARDAPAPPPGAAQRPQERPGWPDGDVGGQAASQAHAAAASPEVPDLPAPGPGPQGAAPKAPEELVPRDPAQGCPCPPAPASSAMPPAVGDPAPPGAASGGPAPGPPSPSAAPRGPRPPARPPGSKASEGALPLPRGTACPSLQEATRLIQEEFAFDGYLDNGLEALIMGEYIYALKDLTYATFCGAVAEKFCDLYWGERLLQSLFRVVNGRTLQEPGAQPASGGQASARDGCSPTGQRPPRPGAGREAPAARGRAPCTPPALSGLDADELSRGNLEVGFRPPRAAAATAGEGGRPAGGPEVAARPPQPEEPEFQAGSPGWGSAYHEADCFGADVREYARELGRRWAGRAPSPTALLEPECRQELEQQLAMEKRNHRKTLKFYQKLLQKEKRSKGSEVKTMLCRLKGQLEEMRSRVQLLGLVKKYLQVLYAERWGLEPCALPVVVNVAATHGDTLDFSPLDESSSLIFYSVSKHARGGGQRRARELQAGTPLGLMAYLYSSGAFLEGYVQQFLYTFRYFCTPQDLLHFLLDRISSALPRAQHDPTSTFTKIYRRSFCLLQAWVEDCYAVDFAQNAGLLGRLKDFLSSQILPPDGSAERLLGLLREAADRRAEGTPRGTDLEGPREAEEDVRPLNAFCKRLSEDGISRKSFPWRLARGNGLALPLHKEPQYSIAAALPKPCFFEDVCGPYPKASAKGPYFLTEYSTQQLFSQLTLLQQELFQKCHPVHFLNSRALGVTDKSVAVPRTSSESVPAKTCSLFLPSYVQDKYLLQLLHSADDVSTWVAAEIVTCHSSKLQVTLLSKFLLIAKSCYEQRNFATAMQILGGLEHPAVRQCPAWRILPAKMAEVTEELKAVEVFLKSDSLCLMEGRRLRAQPTLPAARLLAMHVQQLETGGFTMTNGAHRWSKLRNIAKVASQVHAFQENPYTFAADPKLQSCLTQRVACFSGADVSVLAADRGGGFPPAAGEKQSRRIQDKLRRMKATFQ